MAVTTNPTLRDLAVGEEFPELTVEITQDVIDLAALAHLDFNPVHTDIPWAERAQVFGTPRTVAHGMFTMSGMASVVTRHWDPRQVMVVGIDAKLTRPVPVGSTVTTRGRVVELHPRPDRDVVVVRVEAVNQDGDVVGVGNVRVRLEG